MRHEQRPLVYGLVQGGSQGLQDPIGRSSRIGEGMEGTRFPTPRRLNVSNYLMHSQHWIE